MTLLNCVKTMHMVISVICNNHTLWQNGSHFNTLWFNELKCNVHSTVAIV